MTLWANAVVGIIQLIIAIILAAVALYMGILCPEQDYKRDG
jgi:hypothetical protein